MGVYGFSVAVRCATGVIQQRQVHAAVPLIRIHRGAGVHVRQSLRAPPAHILLRHQLVVYVLYHVLPQALPHFLRQCGARCAKGILHLLFQRGHVLLEPAELSHQLRHVPRLPSLSYANALSCFSALASAPSPALRQGRGFFVVVRLLSRSQRTGR